MSESSIALLGEIERRIDRFVREKLLDEEWTGDDPLAARYFDSLALEQLLDHLEESYQILFVADDIVRPNLASVPLAAHMVLRRLRAVQAGDLSW